jgi:2'-5' RNA ligase
VRLFLAIELPDPVRQHLSDLVARYSIPDFVTLTWGDDFGLSSTRPENLHVTLKFLGEVDDSAVAELVDALNRVELKAPLRLRAAYVDLLPSRGPVRVIAAGLDGHGHVDLVRLHHSVEDCTSGLGYPAERRDYRPHITLARAKWPIPKTLRDNLFQFLQDKFPGPEFQADHFSLFESRLGSGARQYIRLARFGG